MRRGAFFLFSALGCLLLAGGCTIVRVEGATPATSVHFGVLRLIPDSPDAMVAVTASGLGLVPGHNGATLGFARSQTVFMNDLSRCRLVIFEAGNDPQSRAFWASAMERARNACLEGENDAEELEN
ncbi:hypothetical protein [Blastomonas sp. AAP53]|uniref:hypothetical protein n=1 Tax=Blastomonas sp. AAP53 TaxID=1248760 RepID=UPI0002ED2280|nr:hypothetical protein [Blastomonas sp. AAP53]